MSAGWMWFKLLAATGNGWPHNVQWYQSLADANQLPLLRL